MAEHLLSSQFVQPVDLVLRDGGDRFRKAAVDDRGHVDMALFAELATGLAPFRPDRQRIEQIDPLGARSQLQARQRGFRHPAQIGPVHVPEQAAELADFLFLGNRRGGGGVDHAFGRAR